jgi:hypothetical protein
MAIEVRIHAEDAPGVRWQVIAAVRGTKVRLYIEKWEDMEWRKCDADGVTGGETQVFAECDIPPADEAAVEALVEQCVGHIERFKQTAAQEQNVAMVLNAVADNMRAE